ncbi:MAG: cytidine/deoxycytidylate deaminase family protein [Candidatus Thorarchaeota archaeon]
MKKEISTFMKIAEEISKNSTCTKRNVGAVITSNGRLIATGYCGAPSKIIHCTPKTCLRQKLKDNVNPELCRGLHAEINCIIQCALHGIKIEGDTVIYCTHFPCMSCSKAIANSNIKKIIFETPYEMDNKLKFDILKQKNIKSYRLFWKNREKGDYYLVEIK